MDKHAPNGPDSRTAPLHPIGVVARRTGISLHVLRAWERRYGVVEPVRTAGGQRLYSDADIQRLRLLREVTEAGRSISQVAELSDEELAGLAAEDVTAGASPLEETAAWYRESCLVAGERMDGEGVYVTLMRAVVSLRPREFMGEVLLPLLHEVGERWHAGRIGPVHEHVISQAARRVLAWLIEAYDSPEGPLLLATTPSGEMHEFGAMAVSAAALEEGWRVVYLGPSLPALEIVRAVRQLRPSHVALSIVNTTSPDVDMFAEIAVVKGGLPAGAGLLVGGSGAEQQRGELERIGARVIADLDELRDVLRLEKRLTRGKPV